MRTEKDIRADIKKLEIELGKHGDPPTPTKTEWEFHGKKYTLGKIRKPSGFDVFLSNLNPRPLCYDNCPYTNSDYWGGRRWILVPEEVNGDGDTKEVMREVQDRLGGRSIQYRDSYGGGWEAKSWTVEFTSPTKSYRIFAKHDKQFDETCMDWDVWHEAVCKRGEIARHECSGLVTYFRDGSGLGLSDVLMASEISRNCGSHCVWTSITEEEYRSETAPVVCPECGRSA